MKNTGIRILLLCVIAVFFLSCENEKDHILDSFCAALEKTIDRESLLEFKNAPLDSSYYYFDLFYADYVAALNEEVLGVKSVEKYLDELKLKEAGIRGYIYLMFRFHSRLNNVNHTFRYYVGIDKRMQREEIERKNRKKEEEENDLLNIILDNKNRWSIGDTIAFIFPIHIDSSSNRKTTVHSMFPYTKDYSEYGITDIFRIEGILTNKLLDSFDLIFKMRVTDLSEEDVLIDKKYEIGDEFSFPLKDYGRPITKELNCIKSN